MASLPVRLVTSRRFWAVALGCVLVAGVWLATPSHRGTLMATIDGVRGRDEVLTYGRPSPELQEYRRLLKERYGVRLRAVAACVVTESLLEYVKAYNETAERRLRERHGRDILAECSDEAQKRYRAEHPDGKWK